MGPQSHHRWLFMTSSLMSCFLRQGKAQNIINGAIKVKKETCRYQVFCSFGCRNLRKIQWEQYEQYGF